MDILDEIELEKWGYQGHGRVSFGEAQDMKNEIEIVRIVKRDIISPSPTP